MRAFFQLHIAEALQIVPETGLDDNECQFAPESPSKTVFIMQLFGRTESISICANVRGLYPYFYVEYPESQWHFTALETFSKDLGIYIERITGQGSIYKICCVRGRRYYGFDQFMRPFFKISFFAPYSCKKAADALNSSRVMNRRLLCYEVHLPFELQFLVDHNIYGMGDVIIQNAVVAHVRHSKCQLEYNINAKDILNRKGLYPLFNSRPDASGSFPERHLMPSIVQMLNIMEFDPSKLLIDLQARDKSSLARIKDHGKLKIITAKNMLTSESDSLSMFPAANDIYLEDFERDYQLTSNEFSFIQLLKSPLFGSQMSKSEHQVDINSTDVATNSSPVKTPTKARPNKPATVVDWVQSDNEEVEQCLEEMLDEANTQFILDYSYSSPVKTPIKRKSFAKKLDFRKTYSGCYRPQAKPPTNSELISWANANQRFLWAVHQVPFYSKYQDRPVIIAGLRCEVPLALNKPFPGSSLSSVYLHREKSLTPAHTPPKITKSHASLQDKNEQICPSSQITGKTQPEEFPQALKSQLNEQDNFVIFSLEIHAGSTDGKLPDPKRNQVLMAVYSVYQKGNGYTHGCVTQEEFHNSSYATKVSSEEALFEKLQELVIVKYDADILIGYEVQMNSWGYLEERFLELKGGSFSKILSRKIEDTKSVRSGPSSEWERRKTSSFQVSGRIVLNIWRIMRSELSLAFYTFENVAMQVLKQNFPKFCQNYLACLFQTVNGREKLLCYYQVRAKGNIELLIKSEVLTRSCEFARLFGVDVYSVFTRGSQYKVESLMARLAHLESLLLFSPSKEDIVNMRAAEQTPLIMEPAGETYVDPVIVLDFQSLYPSIMIAYNFCFSTVIKRIERDDGHLGALRLGNEAYFQINEPIVAVNGAAFTPKSLRQGVLPKMQSELLDARLQIKKRMKEPGLDLAEFKILDARQLALKYILNVSYGYTAASFSGRMPCVEVADAIVGTGRATMDRAIRTIESHSGWKAKVVYGDTDSLFVLVPGRTRGQAFKIGQEIASVITAQNPPPMALKLEKVYQPCCLLAKKRYFGFKYESPEQAEPKFDAKGIETIRRDSCPLVSQMLEKSIQILFTSKDISQVKEYVTRQFRKISKGTRHDLRDFVFARQVKFGTYRHEGTFSNDVGDNSEEDSEKSEKEEVHISTRLPPSAYLAAKRAQKDLRDVAQYGERIPFVVIENGSSRLADQVVSPEELFSDPRLKINTNYYITRQILPALARVLNTVGVEPRVWWANMAKGTIVEPTQKGIGKYFAAANCWFCKQADVNMRICSPMTGGFKFQVCARCWEEKEDLPAKAYSTAMECHHKLNEVTKEGHTECWGTDTFDPEEKCWSLSCPTFWKSVALNRKEAAKYNDAIKVLDYFEIDADFTILK